MQTGDVLPEIQMQTAIGEGVELGAYLDRMLLVQLLRYYG